MELKRQNILKEKWENQKTVCKNDRGEDQRDKEGKEEEGGRRSSSLVNLAFGNFFD